VSAEPDQNSAIAPPDTSIVLATCTRAGLLGGALASLLAQDWNRGHPVEFVIVDDGSTDDTPRLLREFQAEASARHGISVAILQGERAGIAAARNLGFRAARGEWIASFDDDQLASPGWLRALRERAEQTGAVCVGGTLTLLLPEGARVQEYGPRTRGVLGEHVFGRHACIYPDAETVPATNNALLRRDVFNAVGPFDARFTEGGEDKDLFRRVQAAGQALWYEPAAHAGHITPAKRLEESNLRWTSLRLGASDARIRLVNTGIAGAVRLAALRLAVLLLRDAPSLLWGALRRDRRAQLEARCSRWYTEGYLRALPDLLSPEHSRQAFLRSLDFRQRNGERAERTRVAVEP
jgi:GT2 family glycosyltransferase